jgi:3-methylfumaryl-CoA hydratase
MWHYGLFLGATPTTSVSEDGHPPCADFMPPVTLPRRKFAGSSLRYLAPLICGEEARKVSEVASLDLRRRKLGNLVFVGVRVSILQSGKTCVEEQQTIVYCSDVHPSAPAELPRDEIAPQSADWIHGSTELSRFSAVTFNAHRIHFDLPYAKEKEGYPGLVVPGPLTALRLCAEAERLVGAIKTFRFRAEAPLFAGLRVAFKAAINGATCQIVAQRCVGVAAMVASAAS